MSPPTGPQTFATRLFWPLRAVPGELAALNEKLKEKLSVLRAAHVALFAMDSRLKPRALSLYKIQVKWSDLPASYTQAGTRKDEK